MLYDCDVCGNPGTLTMLLNTIDVPLCLTHRIQFCKDLQDTQVKQDIIETDLEKDRLNNIYDHQKVEDPIILEQIKELRLKKDKLHIEVLEYIKEWMERNIQ